MSIKTTVESQYSKRFVTS